MQALQALIKGQIQPKQIIIETLVVGARQYNSPTTKYKLLEIAVNVVLVHYLKQAQAYL